GIIAKAHSGSQTAHLFEGQDSLGNALFFVGPDGGIGLSANSIFTYGRVFSWNTSPAAGMNSSCTITGNADNTFTITTVGMQVSQNSGGSLVPGVDVRPFSTTSGSTTVYEAFRSHPQSAGTPAAGFGSKVSFAAQDAAGTNNVDQGNVKGTWASPTGGAAK